MKFRIGYIAKFDSGGNDDEGAVLHALRELGHEVHPVRESRTRNVGHFMAHRGVDFVLFNKWDNPAALESIPYPKAFWYWDRVSHPDPSLESRNRGRRAWMERITSLVDLGFLTDGDWVAQDTTGKLHWLPQGADSRFIGIGTPPEGEVHPPILFTGIGRGGGRERESFVAEMQAVWGDKFHHVSSGYYGERLKNLIAASKVVVAPDSPVSDRYWSNRVYVSLGFGACMLHPFPENLRSQYVDGLEFFAYTCREELHVLIGKLLNAPITRRVTGEYALHRTKLEHTYTHRCRELVRIVKERLF